MGFLVKLLMFPIEGPIGIVRMVAERIAEEIDADELDETRIEEALVRLSLRYDNKEITEEEFTEQETALLERYEAILDYKQSLQPLDDEE